METDKSGVSQRDYRSYRGHKSEAWHHVSSVRQQSQTLGMFQSTGRQTSWQHAMYKTEGTQGPRAARLRYETRERMTYIELWQKGGDKTMNEPLKRCKSSLQVTDLGHKSMTLIITAALTCCHTHSTKAHGLMHILFSQNLYLHFSFSLVLISPLKNDLCFVHLNSFNRRLNAAFIMWSHLIKAERKKRMYKLMLLFNFSTRSTWSWFYFF